jgi:hypothetical protein
MFRRIYFERKFSGINEFAEEELSVSLNFFQKKFVKYALNFINWVGMLNFTTSFDQTTFLPL